MVSHFSFLLQFCDPLYRFEEDNALNQNSPNLALSLKQQKKKPLHHFNYKFLSSLKSYIYDIYSTLKLVQFPNWNYQNYFSASIMRSAIPF